MLTRDCRDQELRFTVHDSPDYYQLKVSVFNDDKKTEIIGEAWLNLQEVVVPGGGQNDLWHNLNCKGKYAGEIRIEITYYDSRPKQEKVSDKVRQGTPNGQDAARESMRGPREPKPPVKRRPLPADPTGASPSPAAVPDHVQTPPRGHQTPTYISTQSPLQAMEYNTPARAAQPQQHYGQSPNAYGTPPGLNAGTSNGRPLPGDRYDVYDQASDQGHNDPGYDPYNDPIAEAANRFAYEPQDTTYSLPPPEEYDDPPSPGGPPPPPPVHRSNVTAQPPPANDGYNFPPANAARNMPFTPAREDGYRHSMPEHRQENNYQAFNPAQPQARHELYGDSTSYQESPPSSAPRHHSFQEGDNYHQSPPHSAPRHHSYDERYKNYDSMQPTVESAPTTPLPHRGSASKASQYDDRGYDQVPSPAPLNLSGRGSAASGRYSANSGSTQQYYGGHSANGSPAPYQNPTGSDLSARSTYSQSNQSSYSQSSQSSRHMNDDHMGGSSGGYVPPVPPTLVAGMDPVIAREVSDRMYDNRANYNQNSTNPPRGRYPDQHYRHSSHPLSQSEAAPAPFVPAAATYDDRQSRMATNTYTPIVKPRAISPGQSPDPRVPLRKSVSPAPGASPSATGESRRLSGIPFGPDAYNALNPNIPAAPLKAVSRPGQPEFDPEAKIIMHDGREVDPSDHLPESTWAAEPEVRTPKKPAPRASPSGAHQMPSAGRRPLRQAGRPQSMQAPLPSQAPYMAGALSDSSPPAPSSGRNRLQKKAPHRNSAAAATVPQSSPLAPITPYQDNSGYAHRSLPRAATIDFAGENGHYGGGGYGNAHGHRNSYGGGSGPPIPAKVPIQPQQHYSSGPPPAESAWALLEEMKSIDLGSGRARRRG